MHKKKLITLGLYLIAGYLILQPFIPRIIESLSIFSTQEETDIYRSERNLKKSAEMGITMEKLKPIPKENTLVIPKIKVDAQIHEGESESTLNKGIWHRPNSSTPEQGGNTVFAAHRYMSLTAPNSFYNLDKLEIGDEIIVYWQGEEKVYQVNETKVVPATAVEIENPSKEEKITLYTCEPLYSAENRLVVTATPTSDSSEETDK